MELKSVKVSIITVTYNIVSTVEQTIESVLNQTYDNIEYIVVDGMSTDGTWEKICKYKDKVNILIHEKDKGLYDAMNKGIEKATGDIIGIVNGDDWYEKDAVQTVVNNFQDSIDVLYARMNIIGINGKTLQISGYNDINDIWYRMIPHPTVFVRKSVYDKLGKFDLTYSIVADYELIFRFYLGKANFKYIDKVITNFRKGGLTTQKQIDCAKELKTISMLYLYKCPNKEKYKKLIESSYDQVKLIASYEQNNHRFKDMLMRAFSTKGEDISVFGAGIWGQRCAEKLLQCGIKCHYFVDNDSKLHGKIINNIEVITPKQLQNMKCNIIIALKFGYEEIGEQLRRMKNPNLKWIRMFDLYYEGQEVEKNEDSTC